MITFIKYPKVPLYEYQDEAINDEDFVLAEMIDGHRCSVLKDRNGDIHFNAESVEIDNDLLDSDSIYDKYRSFYEWAIACEWESIPCCTVFFGVTNEDEPFILTDICVYSAIEDGSDHKTFVYPYDDFYADIKIRFIRDNDGHELVESPVVFKGTKLMMTQLLGSTDMFSMFESICKKGSWFKIDNDNPKKMVGLIMKNYHNQLFARYEYKESETDERMGISEKTESDKDE